MTSRLRYIQGGYLTCCELVVVPLDSGMRRNDDCRENLALYLARHPGVILSGIQGLERKK